MENNLYECEEKFQNDFDKNYNEKIKPFLQTYETKRKNILKRVKLKLFGIYLLIVIDIVLFVYTAIHTPHDPDGSKNIFAPLLALLVFCVWRVSSSADAKFVYELLKESLSKITVNKYVVESIKFNTSYDQYTTFEYTGTYTVKFKDGDVYLISAPNYQQVGEPVEFVGEEHKISEDIINEEIFWYVESAETYDAKISNQFNYEKYNNEDVAAIKNPDINNLISSVEINRINGNKITDSIPEDIKVQVLNDALTKMFNGEAEDPDGGYTFTLTSTYTQDIGCTYTYEKEWRDKLTPSKSDNNVYKYDDMVAYNTTEVSEEYKNIETDKKVIDENLFKNGAIRYKEYEEPDTTVLYGLSIIDFIDSNEGIYLKYVASKNAAKSEFEGLGRYELKEGYNQIKYILNQLLKKSEENEQNEGKVLPFVYGSSLGYEVTNISAKSNVVSDYVSGMDLLRQYIFSHEGIGPSVTKNSEGVDCYTAYDDGAGNITIGHGINLTGNPKYMNKLSEKYGNITVGTLIPVEEVENIENEMLKVYYDKAKEGTNGLNLKEYQIHALASFAYNYRDINFSEFTRYYNDPNYWNEETDDRYEEVYEKYKENQTAVSQIQAEANLNNKLYTDFFAPIVHDSDGNLLPGLVRRRKSEFILFSLGYYDNLQRFWSLGGSNLPGIELLNADGSINYDNVKELQIWYEQELFNGTTAPLNPQPNSIYKDSDNVTDRQRTSLEQSIKEEYRIYFNATGTYSSSAYPKVIPVNEYFQCTWWAESMAYYFLYSSSGGEINGPIGKGNALGDGGQVASEMAEVYGVPTYKVNELEVGKHYVFSINGHVVYVEAVGNTEIVVSHCGSGTDWYGVSAVSRNSSQINGTYVCMEDILATYGF